MLHQPCRSPPGSLSYNAVMESPITVILAGPRTRGLELPVASCEVLHAQAIRQPNTATRTAAGRKILVERRVCGVECPVIATCLLSPGFERDLTPRLVDCDCRAVGEVQRSSARKHRYADLSRDVRIGHDFVG